MNFGNYHQILYDKTNCATSEGEFGSRLTSESMIKYAKFITRFSSYFERVL